MIANDGLPELMCVPCVLQVSRAFTFKQQCRRSDQTLRSSLGKLVSDNNIEHDSTNLGENTAKRTKIENDVTQVAAEDNVKEHPFQLPIFESEIEDLGSQLDVLSAEIETTSSFEEEIELSSLPSETQFSPVANVTSNDAHEMTKENLPPKFGDYFDEIKLVERVVSLTVETLGTLSSFFVYLFVFIIIICLKLIIAKNFSANENIDNEKKMPTDEFIKDILTDDKLKTQNECSLNCTSCDLSFDTEKKLGAHIKSSHRTDMVATKDVNKNETNNSFECPDCHKVFAEKKILKRHVKIHRFFS